MSIQTKIITSSQLKTAIRTGSLYGFNRQINPDFSKQIDSDGFHVVSVILPFHNGRDLETPHHRCSVLAKVKNTDEPVELVIDIAESEYNTFTDADYVAYKIAQATEGVVKKALHVG
jgi:hypothetical protein